jgi:hypothetical protein
LQGEYNTHCFFESRGDDDLALGGVNGAEMVICFCVKLHSFLGRLHGFVNGVARGGWYGNGFADMVTVSPFPGWCIVSREENGQGNNCNDDEWNYEGHTPCDVGGQVLVVHERIKNCGHYKVL